MMNRIFSAAMLLALATLGASAQVSTRGEDAFGVFPVNDNGRVTQSASHRINVGGNPDEIAEVLACPENAALGWAYQPGFTGLTSADLGRSDGYKTRGFTYFHDNYYKVNGLRFYGFFVNVGAGYVPCNDRLVLGDDGNATNELKFEIQFFTADANGMPYKYYSTEYHTAKACTTTLETGFGTVYYFDVDLNDAVELQEGWISIALMDDGSGAECSFALYGHAGVDGKGLVMINDAEFWSSDPGAFCLLTDGTLLPGVTPPDPVVPDDEELSANGLPIVRPLPATEIYPESYVANWMSCKKKVNGYEVFTYATKKVTEDNTEFHYLKTAFDDFEIGTVDKPESGPFYGDLNDVERYGWTVYNSKIANGALGLDNSMYGILNGSMMSPIYDLSQNGGEVKVTMNVCGRNVTKVNLYLFENSKELSSASMDVTNDWTEHTVTLTGGTSTSYLLVEVDKNSTGNLFISDFDMWQTLPAGAKPLSDYAYDFTNDPKDTSMFVETLRPLYDGELLGYCVTSFVDNQRSDKSTLVYVEETPDGILRLTPEAPTAGATYDLMGRKTLDAQRGVYVKEGRVYISK